jgi:AcrR family transcriptional regulator
MSLAGRHGYGTAESTVRDRRTRETRARIAEAALGLFLSQGYAETTIDQIAEAAGVSRRTVFHHFPAKESMLLDHFAGRREVALQRLQARPASEPVLVSLHAVLRELCEQGYDRRLLAQIRAVLETQPRLAGSQFSLGMDAFEKSAIAVLESRPGEGQPAAEIRALTLMALSWVLSAVQAYLCEGRPSLVECFDEAVTACLRWNLSDLARG